MDKFLQKFKDNLENQSTPEFNEQDWADMQRRLNQQAAVKHKAINYWAWAAVILLLAIFGSNWLVMQELKKANDKISQLEANRDTIIQTNIIYRTDTIFQTMDGQLVYKHSRNTLANNNTPNQSIITASSLSSEKNKEAIISSNIPLNSKKKNYPVLSREQVNMESVEIVAIPKEEISKSPHFTKTIVLPSNKNLIEITTGLTKQSYQLPILSKISQLDKQLLTIKKHPLPKWFEAPIVSIHKKKTIQQYIYPMRPKGIEIGLNYSQGTTFKDFHKHLDINQWGITAQIKFSQPFRLWLAGNYTDLDYETKEMGDKYGVPIIAAPSDNLEFEEANIHRDFWSVSMGLQYNFRPSKQWQPFIGAGYGFSNLTQNKIQYELKEDRMGGNQSLSINEQVIYDNGKNLPLAVFKGGLSYNLTKKWRLQLEGEYLYRIADFNNQMPNILSGRLGILYLKNPLIRNHSYFFSRIDSIF